ncbi:MAG: DNRLRE domain-containing protein [Verrucomicrobia bacterium]|nr:DNRLRE domain-containing protein [Verrucomicrobiota bacterium]
MKHTLIRFCSTLFACVLLAICASAQPTTSTQLFQEWEAARDTHPQIPNNTTAGYRRGEASIPNVPVVNNVVTDFGADPTGNADNTEAFWRAIWDAHEQGGGAVFIPNGNYRIDGFLWMRFDGVVLRGESQSGVHLHFTRHLTDVVGEDTTGSKSKYSWLGGLIWMSGSRAFDVGYSYARNYPDTPFGTDWRTGRYSARTSEFWVDNDFTRRTLTSVTADAEIGDNVLQVADASGVRAGDWVILRFYISGTDNAFQRQLAGSNHVADNYNWAFHSTIRYADSKGYTWPVQIAAVNGNVVTLAQALRTAVKTDWQPHLIELNSLAPLYEAGVENLTIRLNSNNEGTYQHLNDRGWNGIFINRAVNCWVRNVTVADGENGVLVAAGKQITVSNVTLTEFTTRLNTWHHGFTARVMSADLLFEDFVFDVNHRIDHGINSEAFASGLVWRNGTMYKGTFDSHRVIPFDQIRTNIFVVNPAGSGSGGDNDNGLHAGKRLVHWNITAVDRGIWVNHEELFSGGAMVGFFRSGLTGCANQASTVCGTAQQKRDFLEQNTVPAITDLHLAQVQSVRDAYGYVAIVTPAAQTLTVDQGVPQVRIEGAVPSGRTLQTVQLLSNGTVIASTNSLPWDYTWSNVPLGEHMLTARIIDNTGASVESIPTRFVRAQRVLVDEDDADLLRSSGWFSEFNANHHNGKAQRNNTNGSWLEYTFKGTRVVFFGYNYANTTSNAMRIYINGQFVDYVTDRSGGVFQVPIWISPELPEAVYTIRFEFEPHAANASTRALFDYLHIYSTGPVDGAPPAIPGSVDVTPAFATIETNGSAQFTALLRDTNGNIMSPQPSSFNWSVSGGGTISGSGLFSSDGSVGTFTVSASSQSVQGSATVQVTAAQGGGGSSNTYLEANGIVVMEAERYSDNLLNGDFLEWEDSQAGSGFAGTGYVTMTTNASGSRNWPTGAELVYEVVITNPGTYYMNIRRIAPSSAFDSIHIGVNGSLVAAKAFEGSQTTWAWAPSARIVNLGHLPAGLNTIHIQRREPGMSIDRIMLASQIADLPQNTGIIGPEESATVGGQVIPPEVELFSPVANALFPFGSSVELVATVEENENVIESVDFIVNGTWVGSATSAPWTVWTPALSEGIYEVVVEVYVDGQLAVSSDPVEFEVEAPIGNSSTYIEQNGTVVIEAENFADFQSNGDWLVWDVSNAGSGYAGSGYVTMTTQASGSLNWPNGAELIYEVWINNPGTYYMNIRRIAPSSAFDSIHVGVNGNLVAAKVFEGSQTTWAWAPSARIVNLGNLSAGLNTIHIQRREPGMSIDRIMLASTLADLPVNTGAIGPDESPTQGAANPPPPPEEPVILTIPVVEDAYVRAGNSANTAHGTTDATRLVSKGALSSEPQFLREAYLKFDIRQLDPQLILGATVEVVGSLSDDRDTNITTYLHGVASSNWSETTVTWNNKPARDLTAYSSVVVTDDIDRVYSFDVSSLLVDALQQNAEYVTFALVNTQNTNPTTIWHSKETVGGIAAQLVVEAIGGGGNPGNQVDDPQILLTPLADAYTQGGPNANTAYGTSNSQELVVKAIDLNSDFGFHREAMLSFEVPNHIHTLREAKLRLYGNLSSTAGNNIKTFVYAAVDNGWDEATVTHNTRPPRAYVPLDEQTITNGAPTWYEWDVTPFLQHAQENGWSTVTLVLANTQVTSPFTTFHSTENPSGNSPELVLDYEPDVPWVTASFDWNPQVVSYLGGSSDSERVVASFYPRRWQSCARGQLWA